MARSRSHLLRSGAPIYNKKDRQRLTLPGVILVPSALAGLTALFGMGRGDPHRYSHLKVLSRDAIMIRLLDFNAIVDSVSYATLK